MGILSFLTSKPDCPRFKICETCHGKGMVSTFNGHTDKIYGPCPGCIKRDSSVRCCLGAKLKCECQSESAGYEWLTTEEARLAPVHGSDKSKLKGLNDEVQDEGRAIYVECDCGAKYLCIDGPTRRIISGKKERNEGDKDFNKQAAATLVPNGIHEVLRASGSGAL